MDSNKNAKEVVELMVKNIYKAIETRVSSAPYDVTKQAIVTAVFSDGTYQVEMDGELYKIKSKIKQLSVKDNVDVKIPQNKMDNMYIVNAQNAIIPKGDIDLSSLTWEQIE
ncbi:MAG: hypothetical protein RR370_01900 [Synergistaceae bacterium]